MPVPVFGVCDCDYADCYANGCICRLNPQAGFQRDWKDGLLVPARNKDCCHFHFEKLGGHGV